MKNQVQQKSKTTLGGFPFIDSMKRDGSRISSKASDGISFNDTNELVLSEEELLQFWWRY